MFWALFSKIFYFHMIFHIMQWDCIVDLCNIILHLFFCPYNSLCVVIPSLFCLTKTVHWDSPFTDLNDRVNVTSFECECKLHLTSTYQPNLYYLLNFEALYASQIINKLIKQGLRYLELIIFYDKDWLHVAIICAPFVICKDSFSHTMFA